MNLAPESAPNVSELAHAALNTLMSLVGEGQSVALLIDPMICDPGGEEWVVGLEKQRLRVASATDELAPYVVWLDGQSHECELALQASVTAGAAESLGLRDTNEHQVRSLAAWLVPSRRLDAVRRRRLISSLSALSIWPDQRSITFRYWDPRVASGLGDALGETAWQEILAGLGLSHWCCFGASKRFTCMASSSIQGDSTATDSPRWVITSDINWRLQALSWRNRVWHLAQRWSTLQELELSRVHRVVERAMHAGFSHEDDVVRYAHCALTIHPEFDQHPAMVQFIRTRNVEQQSGAFDRFARRWDESFSEELRAGRWLMHHG